MACDNGTVIKCKNMLFDIDLMQALVNWPHDSYAQFNLNCKRSYSMTCMHANVDLCVCVCSQ